MLIDLFREKFKCEEPLEALLLETKNGITRMNLKRGVSLESPVSSYQSASGQRALRAKFRFNHKFTRNDDPRQMGSWTRSVQPDYTISVWPKGCSEEEAEEEERISHIHFDAKYRVESPAGFAHETLSDDEVINEAEVEDRFHTAPKYEDLLKMHAYRDAIRRTDGAYVLYPGNQPSKQAAFKSFYHEILPDLGAFAIKPNENGQAVGLESVSQFIDQVIEHMTDPKTAREERRTNEHVLREKHQPKADEPIEPAPNKDVTFSAAPRT